MFKLKHFFSAILFVVFLFTAQQIKAQEKDWSMNATLIEACSCPMFCQCYFNPEPAGHSGHGNMGEAEHFCKFNNTFHVNKGNYGNVKLDGIEFWVAGDLGGDFSMGKMDWAALTFDPSVTKEQREGVAAILGYIYPVKWNSFNITEDAEMEWSYTKDRAVAKLNGGKTAEVVLNRYKGMNDDPIVISNLIYWGAPRNDGFIMMPNEINAYRVGDKPFEFKNSNGFMITLDITSKDI
jgi:hypothetical protein